MKRWLKFNAVGLVGMAVHFGLLWILIRLGMHYLLATGLSIEAAIVQKFWWHLKWTWADRQVTGRSAVTAFLRFNLANALVLFVGNMLSVWLLTEFWHVNPILANLASLPCGIANFFLTDWLVFLPTDSSQQLPKHSEVNMKTKLMIRSLRNVIFRKRPYFAHLAFTHRCNLHCSFCHIPEERVPEQDTAGMKRIIDRLDRMGVAYLSISGGGEPLLRKDFAEILNYAADKGLFVKITSNGTMPREKYAELLASRVSEIGISLDGVRGNQLPYGHVGPKLLDSIRFLTSKRNTASRTSVTAGPAAVVHIPVTGWSRNPSNHAPGLRSAKCGGRAIRVRTIRGA